MIQQIKSGVLIFILALSSTLFAAPLSSGLMDVLVAENKTVRVNVLGGEYYRYYQDVNGYTLVLPEDEDVFYYAKLSEDQRELIPSEVAYSESEAEVFSNELSEALLKNKIWPNVKLSDKRISELKEIEYQKQNPREFVEARTFATPTVMNLEESANWDVNNDVKGSIVGLALLIDFPDEPANVSVEEMDAILNQPTGYNLNGNNGSLFEYYHDVSEGQLHYTNIVAPNYYRAPHPKSYYETVDSDGLHAMINDALKALDDQGFDFSSLTVDSEGGIRALNVFYAGNARYTVQVAGLWPHAWGLDDRSNFEADGVKTVKYQISSVGQTPTLGLWAHENGHMLLGVGDYYGSNGLGRYCIMAHQHNTNPQQLNPHLRHKIGWDSPIDLATLPNGSVETIKVNSLESYYYQNPNNLSEFFYIDAKSNLDVNGKKSRWEYADAGLFIWHIDTNGWNEYDENSPAKHPKIAVEHASSSYAFGPSTKTIFNDISSPNALWWDRTASGLNISEISGLGEEISFKVNYPVELVTYELTASVVSSQETISLPANCNLSNGATGVSPAGGSNFGTIPQTGDKVYLDADGKEFAVSLTNAGAWWLSIDQSTPYQGTGSSNGPCSVLRGEGVAGGSLSPIGTKSVFQNENHFIDILPDSGYIAKDIRVNGQVVASQKDNYTVENITSDINVQVDFILKDLVLNLAVAGKNGPGSYTGSGVYEKGEVISISVEETHAAYEFDHWVVENGEAEISDIHSKTPTVVIGTDAVILAVYNEVEVFNLTIESSVGGTTSGAGLLALGKGDISAVASEGFRFVRWQELQGNANITDSFDANTSVSLSSHSLIRAEFESIEGSHLEILISGNGSATGAGKYETATEDIPLSATPAQGWRFVEWKIENNSQITISAPTAEQAVANITSGDAVITAVFEPIFEEYSVSLGTIGSGTTTGAGIYSSPSMTISATPSAGYTFKEWRVRDINNITFEDYTSATTKITIDWSPEARIDAVFEKVAIDYSNLEILISGNGSATGAGRYKTLTELVQLIATPAEGWKFSEWRVENNSQVTISAPTAEHAVATIDAGDAVVTAVFEPIFTEYSVSVRTLYGLGSTTGSGVYPSSTMTISATPDEGYIFKEWRVRDIDNIDFVDHTATTTDITITWGPEARIDAVFEKVETNACSGEQDYVAGSGYVTGNKVVQDGNLYECKAWPNGLWCPLPAYEPKGSYGSDAWDLVSSCN